MRSQRVEQDWATNTFTFTLTWFVYIPIESVFMLNIFYCFLASSAAAQKTKRIKCFYIFEFLSKTSFLSLKIFSLPLMFWNFTGICLFKMYFHTMQYHWISININYTILGFSGSSVGKESACSAGDPSSVPELGRFSGEGTGYPLQYSWAFLMAQLVKNPPAIQQTWVWSLGWEDPLEKGTATYSSILAKRIPGTV